MGHKDWKALAREAANEQDPKKLLAIIEELNEALEERENQVLAVEFPPKPSRAIAFSLSDDEPSIRLTLPPILQEPLIRHNGAIREPDYLLLEDAISQGKVRVTELHAGGSVPELRLENAANLPVLVVDGEELVGAKQNRVLNLTVLAPAKQTIVIPVSCVEDARW